MNILQLLIDSSYLRLKIGLSYRTKSNFPMLRVFTVNNFLMRSNDLINNYIFYLGNEELDPILSKLILNSTQYAHAFFVTTNLYLLHYCKNVVKFLVPHVVMPQLFSPLLISHKLLEDS